MKKIGLILIICLSFTTLYSQESESKFSFKIIAGMKYTPFDYIGGGIFGLSISKNNFGFSIRNDISLSLLKDNSSNYFGINKYRTYKYFDFHYSFNEKLSSSLGYGWISNKNEVHILDSEFGYSVISLGVNYLVSENINLELRGDIPFVDLHSPIDQNIAFPASISVIYTLQ